MSVNLSVVAFEKLPNCVSLSNGEVELVIATEIGPRVLRYGFIGGKNVFKIFPDHLARIEKETWKSYGGHRLWHAPEVFPRTYYPDNEPVKWKNEGGSLILECPVEKGTGIGKRIVITLPEKGPSVSIRHEISNHGVWPVKVAAWCLSVMAPGGKAVIPQEEYRGHPECLVPARPVVLWHFTKMNDPRFVWGEKYIQMKEDSSSKTKQKFGICNSRQWAAYVLGDLVFLKKSPYGKGAEYTDMGCNQEFYTEAGFLEIESLSPYTEVAPGESLTHTEQWTLAKIAGLDTEESFAELDRLANTI
jgi:hypothetical protein